MVAFSGPLHRAGLLTRRTLIRAAWGQLVFRALGASAGKLEKLRESVLRLTRGWDQAEISAIVRETLEDVIEPIIFDEALDVIREHQAAGHKVFIVSASPEEVVAPIAQRLGVDEAIATRAELDDEGRYSGRTERYVYGPEKAIAVKEVAERDDLDLEACYAYSDSATDVPMLELVGHPVAVNPDRELARVAGRTGMGGTALHPAGSAARPRAHAGASPRGGGRRRCAGGGRRRGGSLVGLASSERLERATAARWCDDPGGGGDAIGRRERRTRRTCASSDGTDLLDREGGEADEHEEEQQLLHGWP